jgi:hypothetical protein
MTLDLLPYWLYLIGSLFFVGGHRSGDDTEGERVTSR